jgi:hypothetical protein
LRRPLQDRSVGETHASPSSVAVKWTMKKLQWSLFIATVLVAFGVSLAHGWPTWINNPPSDHRRIRGSRRQALSQGKAKSRSWTGSRRQRSCTIRYGRLRRPSKTASGSFRFTVP